jgi:hypothetical protein
MQVWWSKIIILLNLANYNFVEFLRFFPGGLNPFKIQISETCRIYISNSVLNWTFDQWRKLFVLGLTYHIWVSHNFWRTERCRFLFMDSRVWNRFWIIQSKFEIGLGPAVSHTRCPLARPRCVIEAPPGSPLIHRHSGRQVTSEFNAANPLPLPSLREEPAPAPPLTCPLQAEELAPLLCSLRCPSSRWG